jgi:hypothetical protein
MRAAEEILAAGPEDAAGELLAAATRGLGSEGCYEVSPLWAALAQAGTGHALLALAGRLPADPAGERLAREADVVRAEIGRADAKCGVLVAITGAAAVFALTQAHGHGLAHATALAAALMFASATTLALAALRPRLGPVGWCRWAGMTADQVIIDIFGTDDGPAATLAELSRIARVKHLLVRAAADLASLALALAVAGVIA